MNDRTTRVQQFFFGLLCLGFGAGPLVFGVFGLLFGQRDGAELQIVFDMLMTIIGLSLFLFGSVLTYLGIIGPPHP